MTEALIAAAFVVGGFALMWWAFQGDRDVTRGRTAEQEMDEFAAALAALGEDIRDAVVPSLERFAASAADLARECKKFGRARRQR